MEVLRGEILGRTREMRRVAARDDGTNVGHVHARLVDHLSTGAPYLQAEILFFLVQEVRFVEATSIIERVASDRHEGTRNPSCLDGGFARPPVGVPGFVRDTRSKTAQLTVIPRLRGAALRHEE